MTDIVYKLRNTTEISDEMCYDAADEIESLREKLAKYERDFEIVSESLRHESHYRKVAEREVDTLQTRVENLEKALIGWQEWWALPWEAKRPDIAQRRFNAASAALAKDGGQ